MRAGSCSRRCRRSSPRSGGCCTRAAACAWTTARGPRIVGSVVVHVVLDYSNLPFLAAQNPYVGLLRATAGSADVRAARRRGVRGLRLEPAAAVRLGHRRLAALRRALRPAHRLARAVLGGDRGSRRGLGRLSAERPRRHLRRGPSRGRRCSDIWRRWPNWSPLTALTFVALLGRAAPWRRGWAAGPRCRAGHCCARCGPASIARCSSRSSPPWSCRSWRWRSSRAPTWRRRCAPTSSARRRAPRCRRAAWSRTSPASRRAGPPNLPVLDDQPAGLAEPRHWRGHQRLRRHRPARLERAQSVRVGAAAHPHAGRRSTARSPSTAGSTYLARESVGTYEYLVASAPVRVERPAGDRQRPAHPAPARHRTPARRARPPGPAGGDRVHPARLGDRVSGPRSGSRTRSAG